MTYEDYMTCKTFRCSYAVDPECPKNCSGCVYRYERDAEIGLVNNLTPKTGSFIGWKIIQLEQGLQKPRQSRTIVLPDGTEKECRFAVVRLQIPEDAKRSSDYGSNKCRCSKAHVLDIWPVWLNKDAKAYEVYNFIDADHGYSWWNPHFEYHKGKTVSDPYFDECWWNTCSRGIHFFMTVRDAIKYLGEID